MPLFSRNRDTSVESLNESSRALIQRLFGDVSKASVAKQLAVGCVTGWCSGYLFTKVGKAASMAVGGGLIILQVAHHQGWINVHWGNVDKTVKIATNKMSAQNVPELLEKVILKLEELVMLKWSESYFSHKEYCFEPLNQSHVTPLEIFVRQNIFLSGGFAGGFFIGLAS